MRWQGDRESENVEDERGSGGFGGFGGGGGGGGMPIRIGGIGAILVLVVGLFLGVDPSTLLALLSGDNPPQQTQNYPGNYPGPSSRDQSGPYAQNQSDPYGGSGYGSSRPPETRIPETRNPETSHPDARNEDPRKRFVSVVLADTEDVWRQVFADMGRHYDDPKLVLYSDVAPSGCGMARSATGPFYCPNDQKAYLDLSFFDELKNRFHASGDFAEAYVIAHEIGHHVQDELGILRKAQAERERSDQRRSNAISVRTELQADCFAGVWAYHADRTKHILEQGDVEAALNAASAVGDDRLQRQTRGTVVPDTFTHGSSEQRVRWFKRGFASGKIGDCDTFSAAQL